jgi:hypothetical protein
MAIEVVADNYGEFQVTDTLDYRLDGWQEERVSNLYLTREEAAELVVKLQTLLRATAPKPTKDLGPFNNGVVFP